MKITKNKIIADFEFFSEFCKAVDKGVPDKTYIYFSYDGDLFKMYAQGEYTLVYVEVHVKGKSSDSFSAGIESDKFIAAMKKLYAGEIILKIVKNKVELKKDNINIKFPIISGRDYIKLPEGTSFDNELKDWVVSNLIQLGSAIEETNKKTTLGSKFLGILLENKNGVTRLAKFAPTAIFLSSHDAFFQEDYRVIIPDSFASFFKAFTKNVESIIFTDTHFGCVLDHGIHYYCTIPYDSLPLEYIQTLTLVEKANMISEDKVKYEFDALSLLNAVDLVSSTLGDIESWASLSILGTSEGGLVWEVKGKAYNGVEVKEQVESFGSQVLLDPFSVNQKRLLKSLSLFGDGKVYLCDLSMSSLVLTDASGSNLMLLSKTSI